MYIGPWQELRLGQLLADHKRLMEQSVHQQLRIIKQQQLIQTMHDQQQQQPPQPPQPHMPPLPRSVLSAHSPRSHSHQSSYGPSLVRDLSIASTLSNSSNTAPSYHHHSTDSYPLLPLLSHSRSSSPSSRQRYIRAVDGEQGKAKKKSARATKEQVAAERREQIEKMRVVYGLDGGKQDEEQKAQQLDVTSEPYLDERAIPQQQQQQYVPLTLPRPQRIASADVLVISAEEEQSDPIRLPAAIADYLLSAAAQPKPTHTTASALPELPTANLFLPSRSRASTDLSSTSSDDSEMSDTSDRSPSPPGEAVPLHRASITAAATAGLAADAEPNLPQSSLPPLPLSAIAHPTLTAAAAVAATASLHTPTTGLSSVTSQRLMGSPAPPRMSEDEYLRGMAVSKSQQRASLETDVVEREGQRELGQLAEPIGSSWAAQYDIVMRPQTALLLSQLASSSTVSTPQRGPVQLPATMPLPMRSLGLEAAASPLVGAEVTDPRSPLRSLAPLTLNGSRPQTPVRAGPANDIGTSVAAPYTSSSRAMPAAGANDTAAHSSSRSSTPPTPPTLPAISQQPPAATVAAAVPRSLSLFARPSPAGSSSVSSAVRPSMEMTLQARRSISLEPLALADGRERRGTSVESEVDEVTTAMLEEETEKLLSFVQMVSVAAEEEEPDMDG